MCIFGRMTKSKKGNIHEIMIVDMMETSDFISNNILSLLKSYGLTRVQYNILRILRGARPEILGVGEVKSRMRFSNSDVSRLIHRLLLKELVDRKICPQNRRKMDVTISEEGLKVLKKIDLELIDVCHNFYSDVFTKKEAIEFSKKLKEMRQRNLSNT